MLRTVKDACELHPMALDYAMSEQIENLSDVIQRTEAEAGEFFEKNYITRGMELLLSQGLKRLAGRDDQAVFELKQAMGGGKTHSMIAFGLLARNSELRRTVVPRIAAEAPFDRANVVAVNGRAVPRDRFLWGEIAAQLGKAPLFAKFWKDGADAPLESDWIELIGDQPTLILLDELPPYFDYAVTRPVGAGTLAQVTTFALSNLLSAALKLKRCCIVLSNLSGSYEGATNLLRQAIRNFEQESNRQARALTPVDLASQEIYDILRKRLFRNLPNQSVVDSVASAYAQVLSEAAKSKSIARSAELIAEEIHASYPFHPSVKHVIALFKENESYRQTRGLMQFISKMIKSVWSRPDNDAYLIGCQHLDLNLGDVREEINRISNLQGAIAHDIAAGGTAAAEVADASLKSDAASQVASLILTASLSESIDAVKGFTRPQMLECLIAPNRTAIEFQDAFEALRSEAWYLHRKENDAFYFSNIENLKKRIDNRAEAAPQPKIDAEMKRRLEEIFRPINKIPYQETHALPQLDEIKLNGPRVCLVLSPDIKQPQQEAQRFWGAVTEKNNFCIVTGDGSTIASLEEKTRRIWAIARVLEETGGDKSPHRTELEDEAEQARLDFNTTVVSLYNRIYYPTRNGLTAAKLALNLGNPFHAEDPIEQVLSGTGVLKLKSSVDAEAEMLMSRAEEMLWPGTERRIPWRDVQSRALTNPRWLWLPPKGLEQLRKIAEGQGRWRYTEDGYIEKGPFPAPKTSVSISERGYDEKTGVATIEVLARDGGPNVRVHHAPTPDVSKDSPLIRDTIFETNETVLWFLAVDPDGKHETGEPRPWSNRLNLTHERKMLPGGKRIVELTVKPRGTIRWNTTGANPKDGQVYTGPIELDGKAEVTIYAYAEDQGVPTQRTFVIPKPDQVGPTIDRAKPATLRKKLDFFDNAGTFAALNSARSVQAKLREVTVKIGTGTRNVVTRFGSESVIPADKLEAFIAAARQAIGDETAEVVLGVGEVQFQSGHDLETYLTKVGVGDIGAGEVEQ